MKRRFLWRVVFWACAYVAASLVLDGTIFLLSHLPPTVVHLDGLILRLGALEGWMIAPRVALRHLWPREATPAVFNYLLSVANCLIWGCALASLQELWLKARK